MNDTLSKPAKDEPGWVQDVLGFWFGELGEERWFAKDAQLDGTIRDRFEDLHGRLLACGTDDLAEPRALLAAVIVLDQFSRNIYRGTPRAFSADPLARQLAGRAVDAGLDRGMSAAQRMFLYLPFEHSEHRDDQARAVELIARLGNEDWTRYAKAHKALIDRFGRFPHRNEILGRSSTPEEVAALQAPMGSF
jgi:uncharacterized protein (DUF924 family)